MVFNPHGVPGVIVPFRVVEEHLNVIERAQILPQVTEERIVLGQRILHNPAAPIIVQVGIFVLQRKPSTKHTRLRSCKDAIKPVLPALF